MIRHSIDFVQSIVHLLNPRQLRIYTQDQQLFVIVKLIQWNWPDVYGEEKFVIFQCGLHIEIHDNTLLDGSG